MDEYREIVEMLESKDTSAINRLCGAAGLRGESRAAGLEALKMFYADPANIVSVWRDAPPGERALIEAHVLACGDIDDLDMELAADRHDLSMTRGLRGCAAFMGGYPKAGLLFVDRGRMPDHVMRILKKAATRERVPARFAPGVKDIVISRERRLSDFAVLAKLTVGAKISITDKALILRSAAVRIQKACGYDEVCERPDGKFCEIDEIKKATETKVTLPLVLLAQTSFIIYSSKGAAKPTEETRRLLSLPDRLLAKEIYEKYIDSELITESDLVGGYILAEKYIWPKPRLSIAFALERCPIGEFVSFADFVGFVRRSDKRFLRRHSGRIRLRGASGECAWDNCEPVLIEEMLSFFCAIGMVDLAWRDGLRLAGDHAFPERVGVAGLRLTKLGAWILGMTDAYESAGKAKADEGGMLVN